MGVGLGACPVAPGIFIRVCTCKGGVEIRHLLVVNFRLASDAGCVGRAAGFGDGDSVLGLLRLCSFGEETINVYDGHGRAVEFALPSLLYVHMYCTAPVHSSRYSSVLVGGLGASQHHPVSLARTLISLSPVCLIPLPPHLFSLAIDNPRVSCPSHPCYQTYPMLTGSLVRSLVACQATHRCGRVTHYIHRTGSCVCAYLRHLDAMRCD